jgi:hypothetical protein
MFSPRLRLVMSNDIKTTVGKMSLRDRMRVVHENAVQRKLEEELFDDNKFMKLVYSVVSELFIKVEKRWEEWQKANKKATHDKEKKFQQSISEKFGCLTEQAKGVQQKVDSLTGTTKDVKQTVDTLFTDTKAHKDEGKKFQETVNSLKQPLRHWIKR